MVKLINDSTVSMLPLDAEPIADWGEDNDLVRFLVSLFDLQGEVLSPDGTKRIVNYSNYGREVYTRARSRIRILAENCEGAANETPIDSDSEIETVEPARYLEDPEFGRAAKHIIVWDGVTDQLLGESAFFSLAHLLESGSDIDCSMELTARFYYKQALQILRNFIEDVVLPVHFGTSPRKYLSWQEDGYRTPRLRGKKGILDEMVNRGVIPRDLAEEVSAIYDDLNGCVHGKESRLIHSGLYSGAHQGLLFSQERMRIWAGYVTRCVVCGVRLMDINLDQLEVFRATGRLCCDVCHGVDSLEVVEESTFGGEKSVAYKCKKCGSEMRLHVPA